MLKSVLRCQTIRLSNARSCSLIDQTKSTKIKSKDNNELKDAIDNLKNFASNDKWTVKNSKFTNYSKIEFDSFSDLRSTKNRSPRTISPSKLELTTNADILNKNIKYCENAEELLNLIEPYTTRLASDQIESAINRLIYLFPIDAYSRSRKNFIETLYLNATFRELIDRTNQQIQQLTNRCLIDLIRLFSFVVEFSKNAIFKNTLGELKIRLEKSKLEDDNILNYLKNIDRFIFQSNCDLLTEHELFKFNEDFIRICKTKLLNNELDLYNFHIIKSCYTIFLGKDNDSNEAITFLTKKLLTPGYQLDFDQAVGLLSKIKQNYRSIKRYFETLENRMKIESLEEESSKIELHAMKRRNDEIKIRFDRGKVYPSILNDLVKKCNETIFNAFNSSEIAKRDINFYITKVHYSSLYLDNEFTNFYDERLLAHLAKFANEPRLVVGLKFEKFKIYKIIKNYAFSNYYDVRLLKQLYSSVYHENQVNLGGVYSDYDVCDFYLLLSKYRLPFVDHRFLISKMINQFRNADALRILCELILNDVNNEQLFKYLIDSIDQHYMDSSLKNMSFDNFKRIVLARAYLLFKKRLDNPIEIRIKTMLNESIKNFYITALNPANKFIENKYFQIDSRLQKGAYLSNGTYIDYFSIYDKTKQDLISLDEFTNLFDKIDQIPIEKDQEL